MRISDNEIKKILSQSTDAGIQTENESIVGAIVEIGVEADRKSEEAFVKEVVRAVVEMPDREEMIADLRARIEAKTYLPSGDEIADTMIRRNIADRLR